MPPAVGRGATVRGACGVVGVGGVGGSGSASSAWRRARRRRVGRGPRRGRGPRATRRHRACARGDGTGRHRGHEEGERPAACAASGDAVVRSTGVVIHGPFLAIHRSGGSTQDTRAQGCSRRATGRREAHTPRIPGRDPARRVRTRAPCGRRRRSGRGNVRRRVAAAPSQTLKRTPLFDRHVAAGARTRALRRVGDARAVRRASARSTSPCATPCGVFDVSHMGEIETSGPQARAAAAAPALQRRREARRGRRAVLPCSAARTAACSTTSSPTARRPTAS